MSSQNCIYFAGSLNGSSKKAKDFCSAPPEDLPAVKIMVFSVMSNDTSCFWILLTSCFADVACIFLVFFSNNFR